MRERTCRSTTARAAGALLLLVLALLPRPALSQGECADAYRLRLLHGVSASAAVGQDVILVHGFVLSNVDVDLNGGEDEESCRRATNFAPAQDYWLADNVGTPGNEWTGVVRALQAAGRRVWTYQWPTHLSHNQGALHLVRLVQQEQAAGRMGGELAIVAHSMGGIVTLGAMVESEPFRRSVLRVVTLGTPFKGTPTGSWGERLLYHSVAVQEISADERGESPYIENLRGRVTPAVADRFFIIGGLTGASACGSRLIAGNPDGGDDCVVGLRSAYDGFIRGRSELGFRQVTMNGGPYDFYNHTQIMRNYRTTIGGFDFLDLPLDASRGQALRTALDTLLFDNLTPRLTLSSSAQTLGTSNSYTTTVTVVNANPIGTANGVRTTIAYAGSSAGWLTATLSQSTATAGAGSRLTLTGNPVGLSGGSHLATVTVHANGVSAISFAVEMAAPPGAGPVLSASRTTVAPGETFSLSWTEASGATSYVLEPSLNGSFVDLQHVATTGRSFQDRIFTSGAPVSKQYRVRANNSVYSNVVTVTALPSDENAVNVAPTSLLMTAALGGTQREAELSIAVDGKTTFAWRARGVVSPGDPYWFVLPNTSGTQATLPLRVRADPAAVTTARVYSGYVEVWEDGSSRPPVRIPVTFDVRSGMTSGIDLVVDSAWIDYAYYDPRTRTPAGRDLRYHWRVRNIGTQPLSATTSGYGYDVVFWGTSPDPAEICRASVNLDGRRLNYSTSLAPGASVVQVEQAQLPEAAYTAGQSYLLFITDGDWDSGRCLGLPGAIAESNENNNHLLLPVYIPRPPRLVVDPQSIAFDLQSYEASTRLVGVSNGGDRALDWTVVANDTMIVVEKAASGVVVTVDGRRLAPGSSSSGFTITSNGGSAIVPVSIQLAPRPLISASLAARLLQAEDSASTTLSISNAGGGILTWTATSSAPWLRIAQSSGSGSAEVRVTAYAAGLVPGEYVGRIEIQAAGADALTAVMTLRVPPPPTVEVRVVGAGGGSGLVISEPSAILCAVSLGMAAPSGCATSIPRDSSLLLIAVSGTVEGWGGACGSATACRVEAGRDTVVNVAFVLPPLAISTSLLPDAWVGQPFVAQLAATGASGTPEWSVDGAPTWLTVSPSGALSGTPGFAGEWSLEVTLRAGGRTAARRLVLRARAQETTLAVGGLGTGDGMVLAPNTGIACSVRSGGVLTGTCAATVAAGDSARLTAQPAAGSRFDAWLVAGSAISVESAVSIPVANSPVTVVARFQRQPAPDFGYRLSETISSEIADLAQVVRTEAGPGWRLADWTVLKHRASGHERAWLDTLGMSDEDAALVQRSGARFWDATRHYFVQRFDDRQPYAGFLAHDALADPLVVLGSWMGLRMRALMAREFTISVGTADASLGSVSGGGVRQVDDTVSVVATPSAGNRFVGWHASDALVSSSETLRFRVAGDSALVARFAPLAQHARVDIEVRGPGQVRLSPDPDSGSALCEGSASGPVTCRARFPRGQSVVLAATPAVRHQFAGFSGDCVGGSDCALTLSADRATSAVFERLYRVASGVSPAAGGIVSPSSVSGTRGHADSLLAQAHPGYRFLGWTTWGGADRGTDARLRLIIVDDDSLIARFRRVVQVSLRADPIDAGEVSGGGTLDSASTMTAVARSRAGWGFRGWFEADQRVSLDSNWTHPVAADRQLVARFGRRHVVAARVEPANAGTVTGGGTFTAGDTAVLTVALAAGHVLRSWSEGTQALGGASVLRVVVSRDHELVARLEPRLTMAVLPDSARTIVASSPYSRTLSAAGGVAPYAWSATGLPPGLQLVTGTLSGTPTTAGVFESRLIVASDIQADTQSIGFTILPAPGIAADTLPHGHVGRHYGVRLRATGGTGHYTWRAVGALPPGLFVRDTGSIEGTPAAGGSEDVTLEASSGGATVRRTTALRVWPALALDASEPPTRGIVGLPYAATMRATGGTGSYAWSVVGGLQGTGLFLESNGAISGTPIAAGTVNARVRISTPGADTVVDVAISVVTQATLVEEVVGRVLAGSAPSAADGRALDRIGNRNDRFDLGDVLALLDRNPGIQLPVAVISRLMEMRADEDNTSIRRRP